MKQRNKKLMALLFVVLCGVNSHLMFTSNGEPPKQMGLQEISSAFLKDLSASMVHVDQEIPVALQGFVIVSGSEVRKWDTLKGQVESLAHQFAQKFNNYAKTHFAGENAQKFYRTFYHKLENFERALENQREVIFSLMSRSDPDLGNALAATYKENFKKFPTIDPKKLYERLGLNDKAGMEKSLAEIRNYIEQKIQDNDLKRQFNHTFANAYTKENYDAYLKGSGAVAGLVIDDQTQESLQNMAEEVINLKNIVKSIMKTISSSGKITLAYCVGGMMFQLITV